MWDLKTIKFMNTPKEVAKQRYVACLTNGISDCVCRDLVKDTDRNAQEEKPPHTAKGTNVTKK